MGPFEELASFLGAAEERDLDPDGWINFDDDYTTGW